MFNIIEIKIKKTFFYMMNFYGIDNFCLNKDTFREIKIHLENYIKYLD